MAYGAKIEARSGQPLPGGISSSHWIHAPFPWRTIIQRGTFRQYCSIPERTRSRNRSSSLRSGSFQTQVVCCVQIWRSFNNKLQTVHPSLSHLCPGPAPNLPSPPPSLSRLRAAPLLLVLLPPHITPTLPLPLPFLLCPKIFVVDPLGQGQVPKPPFSRARKVGLNLRGGRLPVPGGCD